ncbi:MAG: MBL fold metallo-hydrolase [Chlorobi bacterium]|nr:MBL fold metallo-hydrolase [Chlorobiota bacterium]
MTLTFLGTASGLTVLNRRHSSIMVEASGKQFLLDAGEGVTQGLLEWSFDPDAVSAVCVSHTHPDHAAGLPMLLQTCYLRGRTTPLDIYLPEGRIGWFENMLHGFNIFDSRWKYPVPLHSLEEAHERLPLEVFRNHHLDTILDVAPGYGLDAVSYSFLVSGSERRVLVSSDISGTDDIVGHLQGVDILVLDATHAASGDIVELAEQNPELTIILTHIPPEVEEEAHPLQAMARNGRMTLAEDGFSIRVN